MGIKYVIFDLKMFYKYLYHIEGISADNNLL